MYSEGFQWETATEDDFVLEPALEEEFWWAPAPEEKLEVGDPSAKGDRIGPIPTLNQRRAGEADPLYRSIIDELEKSLRYGGGAVKTLTKATMLWIASIVGIQVGRNERREKRFMERKLQAEEAIIRSKLQDEKIRLKVVACISCQAVSQKEAYERRRQQKVFAGHSWTKTRLPQHGGFGG
jgi:hypothetical protein